MYLPPGWNIPEEEKPEEAIRAFMFETVTALRGGRREKMTRFDAYINRLYADALKGDSKADRELTYYVRFRIADDKGVGSYETPQDHLDRLERGAFLNHIKNIFCGTLYFSVQLEWLSMWLLRIHRLDTSRRRCPGSSIPSPFSEGKAIAREASKGASPDVGRGCPPKEFRFRPGQSGNPAGRRDRRKPLSVIDEIASRQVAMTDRRGRSTKVSGIKASCLKVYEAAIGGDASARRTMRSYVKLLRSKQLFSAPPPDLDGKRLRLKGASTRAQGDGKLEALQYRAQRNILPYLKKDLAERFIASHERYPDIVTEIEKYLGFPDGCEIDASSLDERKPLRDFAEDDAVEPQVATPRADDSRSSQRRPRERPARSIGQ